MIQQIAISLLQQRVAGILGRQHGGERADDCQEADGLGYPRQECGNHRRRSFIDVGRVKVERHGRDFEAQPRQNEHRGEQPQLGLRHRQPVIEHGDRLQVAHARRSVKEREPVQQEPRRKDAQIEVLGGSFLRSLVAVRQIEQQVGRNADQLEPHEQEDDFVGRRDEHRPGIDHEQGPEEFAGTTIGRFFVRQAKHDEAGEEQHRAGKH